MVAAFLLQDWRQIGKGEHTQTGLVLGWVEFTLCTWHCFSLGRIKPGRRFWVDGDTPLCLQSLLRTCCSGHLWSAMKLMLQAGWVGTSGGKILPPKGMMSGVGMIPRSWDFLPVSFLQVHISPHTLTPETAATECLITWPDKVIFHHEHSKYLHFSWRCKYFELYSFILARFSLPLCFLGNQYSKERPVYLWLACNSSWTALGF